MTLAGLLNQSVTLYSKASYNAEGREVMGSGVSVSARAQETTKRKLLPNGSQIEISLILYVEPSTTVSTDDKVTYNGNNYKVFSKYNAVDEFGAVNHIKLECIKWRAT